MHSWQDILAWSAQTAPGGPGGMNPMFILIAGIFIFMLYTLLVSRPQQKAQERKREEAISSLAKGDQVVTTAGIHGTVESMDKEKGVVNVTVAPKVTIRFSKTAIASYTKKEKLTAEEKQA
jgi:preprotein translocase subunit YajC